jgi:[pyruvate, water dikinase]-phosphate phosphotransferase / [pyruvate, water dikinase] kinase
MTKLIHAKRKVISKRARKPRAVRSVVHNDVATPVVHVLSDSTGNLARHTLAALLTQFPPGSLAPRYHAFIRTRQRLADVFEQIRHRPGPVCHAVVSETVKRQISDFCQAADLPHHDLTAGTVQFLSKITRIEPHNDLESLHRLDEGYRRRIGAIEFTLTHDDGLGLSTLGEADIVLAGVSRTGKTPTSIYLAQQGYRVANVSLAFEVPPPDELLALPRKKVVGLAISPQQLIMIRARRAAGWRMDQTHYGNPSHVAREIAWARQLFTRQGWPVLDVTDQAIEETAAKIIEVLGLTCGPPHTDAGTDLP